MPTVDRRTFMTHLSALGLGGAFADAIWTGVQEQEEVTAAIIRDAEMVAGLDFTEDERELMVRGLNQHLEAYRAIRQVTLPNQVPPAIRFDPALPHAPAPAVDEDTLDTRYDEVRTAWDHPIGPQFPHGVGFRRAGHGDDGRAA